MVHSVLYPQLVVLLVALALSSGAAAMGPPSVPSTPAPLPHCYYGLTVTPDLWNGSAATYLDTSPAFAFCTAQKFVALVNGTAVTVSFWTSQIEPVNYQHTYHQTFDFDLSLVWTQTEAYTCETDACNNPELAILYGPSPPSPPTMPPSPPSPPFPPGPPGSISCYEGRTGFSIADYDSTVVLTPGFEYCLAGAATVTFNGTKPADMVQVFYGQSRDALGNLPTCADNLRDDSGSPERQGNATVTGHYCCYTNACNSPDVPIVYAPSPPVVLSPPLALSPPLTPSLPPSPPGSISCYVGVTGYSDAPDYDVEVVLTSAFQGFSYCIAGAAAITFNGLDHADMVQVYRGQSRDALGNLPTCANNLEHDKRDVAGTSGTAFTGTVTGYYCCYTNACNAPGKPIVFSSPPPSPAKKKHKPPPPCKKKHVKPPPKRKSPLARIRRSGRRMAL